MYVWLCKEVHLHYTESFWQVSWKSESAFFVFYGTASANQMIFGENLKKKKALIASFNHRLTQLQCDTDASTHMHKEKTISIMVLY